MQILTVPIPIEAHDAANRKSRLLIVSWQDSLHIAIDRQSGFQQSVQSLVRVSSSNPPKTSLKSISTSLGLRQYGYHPQMPKIGHFGLLLVSFALRFDKAVKG